MKKFIFSIVMISSLSGCASYAELQSQCQQGEHEACITLANRTNVLGGMNEGIEQSNQLEAIRRQQAPVITNCNRGVDGSITCVTF